MKRKTVAVSVAVALAVAGIGVGGAWYAYKNAMIQRDIRGRVIDVQDAMPQLLAQTRRPAPEPVIDPAQLETIAEMARQARDSALATRLSVARSFDGLAPAQTAPGARSHAGLPTFAPTSRDWGGFPPNEAEQNPFGITIPVNQAYGLHHPGIFNIVDDKTEVDCRAVASRPGRRITIVAAGPSNAANQSETRFRPTVQGFYNFNFLDGKCYLAADPMLGATGERGSVWSRVGELLIEDETFDTVVIATVAVGGTAVHRWTPGNDHFPRMEMALRRLREAGLEADVVAWAQGESDGLRGTERAAYVGSFVAMVGGVRAAGFDVAFLVGRSTGHGRGCGNHAHGAEIRAALAELVSPAHRIFEGADTDVLQNRRFRFDGCHFTDIGLLAAGQLWASAIEFHARRHGP